MCFPSLKFHSPVDVLPGKALVLTSHRVHPSFPSLEELVWGNKSSIPYPVVIMRLNTSNMIQS